MRNNFGVIFPNTHICQILLKKTWRLLSFWVFAVKNFCRCSCDKPFMRIAFCGNRSNVGNTWNFVLTKCAWIKYVWDGMCITASGNISFKLFVAPLETIALLTFWYNVLKSYCAIIRGFQLLVQNKLFPSLSCQFFCNVLKNPLFTVKKIHCIRNYWKNTKEFLFPLVTFYWIWILNSLQDVDRFLIVPMSSNKYILYRRWVLYCA